MNKNNISIIVAIAENRAIGKNNELLWHISEDLKHFKNTTSGHTVIMGRKTYESLGRPLPNRRNIVISRNPSYCAEGCETATSLNEAIKITESESEVFVIGGGQIYAQAMDIASKIYLTIVHKNYDADTFFPEIDDNIWNEISREEFLRGAVFEHRFSFLTYIRK